MGEALEFTLNGEPLRLAGISPNTTLLEYLRGARLTGTKEGCAEGDCGACSVVVLERDGEGQAVCRAVNSCLLPVCLLSGREVVSVEGIGGSTRRHPVQQKMIGCHGSQCGYCTPGFVCSLFEGYYRDDLRTQDDLDEQLAGNLCRCTGYRAIRDAAIEAFVQRAEQGSPDAFVPRLASLPRRIGSLHYQCEDEKFFRPESLSEMWRILEAHPQARLIAGATELGLDITKRFQKFPTLMSLDGIPELKRLESSEDQWRVGAAATLTAIEDKLGTEFPMLADMLRVFGSRQIRNRATMGGNLVTASPIGDSAPVLLALDAQVVLVSLKGERTLSLSEFFTGYRRTALQTGEVLKTILIPRGASAPGLIRKSAWFKVSKRREMDISTVAAAFVLDLDAQGTVRHARLGYGGVAAVPARARKTEAALLGKTWNAAKVDSIITILESEFAPISDVRGSAEYRSGLITDLLRKFCLESADGTPDDGAASRLTRRAGQKLLPSGRGLPTQIPHESAHKHVTGEAKYTDDLAVGRNLLEVWPVCAPHARARILRRDASAAVSMPGVKAVLLAEDVPGANDVGAVRHDEILLADKEVFYHGQIVALVVGETQEACRNAAARVAVEYEPLPPILGLDQAIAQNSFHTEPNCIRRGDVESALRASPHVLEGDFYLAGQEHFYLEMQAAWAEAGEDGSMFVMSSTQHPSEVQHIVAHLLEVPVNKVVVQCPRMGGGFGGKETQAATFAALAALAAARTGRPVRVRVNRDLDMILTGKRHPFLAKFRVGYNGEGDLLAARIALISNGGWSLDLSTAVTDRAMFHLDNSYYIPAVEFSGRVAKTNLASNTAFRGFGGPQGMLVIEEIIDRIARRLGKTPEEIRERNLYRGRGETNTTHYGQEIEDNRIPRIWRELKASSGLETRRANIAAWNREHPHQKRGLAMTPVKFGISFTVAHLNQAGAFVVIYRDGSVQINHGGTEMGQGVHTNIALIASRELGVSLDRIRVMATSTDKVPNTSATAASCSTDLNGMAVKNACETLLARLAPVAAALLSARTGREIAASQIRFENNYGLLEPEQPTAASPRPSPPEKQREQRRVGEGLVGRSDEPTYNDRDCAANAVAFTDVVQAAYLQRLSLSATGFYRTPEIHYDRVAGQGKPFHYFAVGAAVTEVEVDGFTGMSSILRVDILHDVGDSINPAINLGQIEGGFVQGAGWLTCEELVWNDKGELLTHSPDTYKIPAVGNRPIEFHVSFLQNATQKNTVHGSKAVGEPPLMLALSVREAIRDAVSAFGPAGGEIALASPATCEAIWKAIQARKKPRTRSANLEVQCP